MHGCRGIQEFQKNWAERFAKLGYVTLLVDSYSSRQVKDLCRKRPWLDAAPEEGGRVMDAYGAYEFLQSLSSVDGSRIALVGWAHDMTLDAILLAGNSQFVDYSFAATVAFYPSCMYSSYADFNSPLLVLVGAEDDWVSPWRCARMPTQANKLNKNMPTIDVIRYSGAAHGFDDYALKNSLHLKNAWNPSKTPPIGATLQYNKQATEQSIQAVQQFLSDKLQAADS